MEYYQEFPDWDRLVKYFENSRKGSYWNASTNMTRLNFEDLLNNEAYRLWKLYKKM